MGSAIGARFAFSAKHDDDCVLIRKTIAGGLAYAKGEAFCFVTCKISDHWVLPC